jgi:hypothetical protein
VAYVHAVLTASAIYQLLDLDLAPSVLQLIDRMRRGFLWAGREEAQGGHCLVAWNKVCQPKALGGLGLHNLRWLSVALRVRWLWFQRNNSSKPWLGFDLPASSDARALYHAAIKIRVGSGERTLFWEDPWIDGLSMACLAPAILKLVWSGPIRTRNVHQGLTDAAWVRGITGTLTVDDVVQFLRQWPLVHVVHLDGSETDSFTWKFSASGEFTTRPTYLACFAGRTALPAAKEIWSSYAPGSTSSSVVLPSRAGVAQQTGSSAEGCQTTSFARSARWKMRTSTTFCSGAPSRRRSGSTYCDQVDFFALCRGGVTASVFGGQMLPRGFLLSVISTRYAY